MTNAAAQTRTIVVEREIPFPPEKIWRALTQPHLIEAWLMKNDFKPAVGHRFNLHADWGAVDCQVQAIEPNRTLSYTWDTKDLESIVTWTLTPTSAGTRLRMEQSGFRSDQQPYYQGAKVGWPRFLAKLEELLVWTVDDAVALIRRRPDMYLHGGKFSGSLLVSRMVSNLALLGALPAHVEKVDQWWIISSDVDWLLLERPDFPIFTQIRPFPEAGDNSHRAEVLLTAFADTVVVAGEEGLTWISGNHDPEAIPPKYRTMSDMRRAVLFRGTE